MTGDSKHQEYILSDYADRLFGFTELDIFNAVEWFIEEDDESDFFPKFAKLKGKIQQMKYLRSGGGV